MLFYTIKSRPAFNVDVAAHKAKEIHHVKHPMRGSVG